MSVDKTRRDAGADQGPAVDDRWANEAHRAALLDFAVGNSSTAFYLIDLTGNRRTVFISDNVEAITGFAADRYVGEGGFGATRLHPDDRDGYHAAMDRLADGGEQVIEYRSRHAGDRWIWVRDRLRLVDPESSGAEQPLAVGVMVDITAEKDAVSRGDRISAINRALLTNVLDAIVATDRDGLVVEFNPAAERMFGYSRDEAVGQSVGDLIVPASHRMRHETGMARFQEFGRMAQPHRRMETRARRKDGSEFPVEIALADTEMDGQPLLIADIQDITERLAARIERLRLTTLIQDAVFSMTEGFVISGPDGRILFCNEAFSKPYGLQPEDMIGTTRDENIRRFFTNLRSFEGEPVEGRPEMVDWIIERLGEYDGPPMEIELTNGEWRELVNHSTSDGGSVTIRVDISDRKRAEQSLRQSEAMVRRILNACPLPVGMTRAEDSLIIYESPASKALFQREDQTGPIYARDHFVDARDRGRYLEILRRDGRIEDFETSFWRRDGSSFAASVSAQMTEYQGEVVIVSSVFDLTERHRTAREMARQREALHQSEKMSALGELLAGVSHELNNPLSVLVGQALLLKETAQDPALVERARKIGDAADRCARIVKTFLAMARHQPQALRPVAVGEIIDSALEMTGYTLRNAGIDLLRDEAEGLPPVQADPDQMNQVLTNLIVNAVHALAGQEAPRRISIATRFLAEQGRVELRLGDTGPGLTPEVARRVFEPFFTTKGAGEGTGLGLTIVHRIIDAHGGTITAESQPGEGTCFVITLPVDRHALAEAVAAPDAAPVAALNVLVIDDEPAIGEIARDILSAVGHRVVVAESGREGLAHIAAEPFDVILTDVRMPDLDGPSLLAEIDARFPERLSRLAFITGDTMSPSISAFLANAGRPSLEKPVTPADLRDLVTRIAEAAS